MELVCDYDANFHTAGNKPPKGVLNWVGQPAPGKDPPRMEARLYDVLFKSENPPDDWLKDLNPESETIVSGGMANPSLSIAKVTTFYHPSVCETSRFTSKIKDQSQAMAPGY